MINKDDENKVLREEVKFLELEVEKLAQEGSTKIYDLEQQNKHLDNRYKELQRFYDAIIIEQKEIKAEQAKLRKEEAKTLHQLKILDFETQQNIDFLEEKRKKAQADDENIRRYMEKFGPVANT